MVSNEEIAMRLRNKREGKSLRYLVCDNCGGYYELQEDESWKDFNTQCECGGQLVQSANDSLIPDAYGSEEEYEHNRYRSEIFLGYALIFFGGFLSVIMGLYLLTRPNKRANFHGKILLLISIIPFFVAFLAIIMYRIYFSHPAVDPYTDVHSVRSMRLIATCFF